jgi:CSLREA domain-containing protein
MMKKAMERIGEGRKGRRIALWAVSPIMIMQVLGLVLFSIATPVPSEAKTFVVNSTLDEVDANPGDGICSSTPSGKCTLRAAIHEANALAGADTIRLKAGLYMLTIPGRGEDACATGDLDIIDGLTIVGSGAKNTFINGGKLDRVLHIIGSISVSITDVTIQNGLATDGPTTGYAFGGGIYSETGTLIIKGVTISNNAAYGGTYAMGGGIFNSGTLIIGRSTLSNSIISNNSATGSAHADGGGIRTGGGNLTIIGASISYNAANGSDDGVGGGILNNGGTVTLTQTAISNNTASGPIGIGGGFYNNGGTVTIKGSTISNNTASATSVNGGGGGIFNNGGTVTVTQTAISSNNVISETAPGYGGGIYNNAGMVTITGSTISDNTTYRITGEGLGGGIFTEGVNSSNVLTVQGASKVVRNFASDEGGGIYIYSGPVTISPDSTVKKNIPNDMYP